ncbi:MAG: 3-deoxy-7-phosphoheptulonate synthase [Dehalococcoidales bacterium]|nr:3-deoxy-7-phosphoheptulonate synthase [Dehalococcoidales bacterium]
MIEFGGKKIVLIAGPCAVESRKQTLTIAKAVKEAGADILRGGAFKPRSSPHRWEGLGSEGLEILAEAREITGLPVVTEAVGFEQIPLVYKYADMLQIGSRNMQSSELLKAFGRQDKPVLLKRGFATTIEEFVMAAEFIKAGGNDKIILCERGIRTFETYTRNTLDINAVPALKSLCSLPIIVDPSHGTFRRELVVPMALAAIAAGADGLMIEVHNDPDNAMTDGPHSLTLEQFADAVPKMQAVARAIGREIG